MKNIKIRNIFKLFIIVFIFIILMKTTCMAAGSDLLGNLDEYGKINSNSNKVFLERVGNFIGVVQVVASILSIICLIVLGIQYMMGSVEQKAEYKKTLFPYMLGAIMVFGIGNLLSIIYNVTVNAF